MQRAAAGEVARQVREGARLSRALAASRQFPSILVHLTASGEATGRLDHMLERAAQTLSRDIERRAMGMTALLEPLMIVVMGAVVLVIVMAVLALGAAGTTWGLGRWWNSRKVVQEHPVLQ